MQFSMTGQEKGDLLRLVNRGNHNPIVSMVPFIHVLFK